MTIRFFILQSHYRSTLDFSNEALSAASKGFDRLQKGLPRINELKVSDKSTVDISSLKGSLYHAMNDDFNSPIAISKLFDSLKMIAAIEGGDETISKVDLVEFKALFEAFFFNILGLQVENNEVVSNEITDELMQLILDYRKAAKTEKNWAVADQIRDRLKELNISIKDGKDGADWSFENKN
jgi:cysteinyl-tRNA synthetase